MLKEHKQEDYFTTSTNSSLTRQKGESDDDSVTYWRRRRVVWQCCHTRSISRRCHQAGRCKTSNTASLARDTHWTTYRLSPCLERRRHTTPDSVPSSRHIHIDSVPGRTGGIYGSGCVSSCHILNWTAQFLNVFRTASCQPVQFMNEPLYGSGRDRFPVTIRVHRWRWWKYNWGLVFSRLWTENTYSE